MNTIYTIGDGVGLRYLVVKGYVVRPFKIKDGKVHFHHRYYPGDNEPLIIDTSELSKMQMSQIRGCIAENMCRRMGMNVYIWEIPE